MFSAPFGRTILPPVLSNAVSAAIPWWLSGGIAAANCVAAYQPKGAASLAASYTNLANPGVYTAAPGVAPTWNDVDGWISDGTKWLDTGVIPTASYTMVVKFTSAGTGFIAGIYKGYNNCYILMLEATKVTYFNNRGEQSVTPAQTTGTSAIVGLYGYRNGVIDTIALPGTLPLDNSIALMACKYLSGTLGMCALKMQAAAIYNITISALQILAVHTAMMAL